MSSDAERLHGLDTEAHKDRAWLFWALAGALSVLFSTGFTPTRAIGATAGWGLAGVLAVMCFGYTLRLYLVRGEVSSRETVISVFAAVLLGAIPQWLQGGYRSPMAMLFTLHVFGGAGVLTGRARAIHLGAVILAVLAPIAYSSPPPALVMSTVVYALVLCLVSGFLFEYGKRLRSQRLALYEAEREASARAVTDALTGLGNRRALELELEAAEARVRSSESVSIVYLDLDGFKAYNDRFGHGTGDALLQRLGAALDACVSGCGKAFRIGGDEFCAVLRGALTEDDPLIDAVRATLTERGSGFRVGPSLGLVVMPTDAADAGAALRLADERMYEAKRSGRPTPAQEISQVLRRLLIEHEPVASESIVDLRTLGRALALRVGLGREQADTIGRAAELHDVGKVAIPDTVLRKPGPLSDEEWRLIRQHTLIGERILASSPSFADIARLVRSSHERIDGAGYPDRLAGPQIPLGARIVAVCDAYGAMRGARPYRAALSPEQALAELARCSGTQFDSDVVRALAAELAEAREPHVDLATAA